MKVGDKMANLAKKLRDEEDKKQIKKLTGKTPKHRCPICHRFTMWAVDGKERKCLMCELIKQERKGEN